MYDHPKFKESRAHTDRIVDGLGMLIDDGIKDAVAAFRACGFETMASCEGHIERGLPYPWIDFGKEKPPIPFSKPSEINRGEISKLVEMLELFSSEYPNPQIYAMVYGEEGNVKTYDYTIMKREGSYLLKDMTRMKPDDVETADMRNQLLRMVGCLKDYYAQKPLDYEQILQLDVKPDMSFRLLPLNADWAKFMDADELKVAISAQQQAFTQFAEHLFNTSH